MPRGKAKELIEINGWLMKPKKEIKTETTVQCPAAYAISKTNGAIRVIKEHLNHEIDRLSNKARIGRQELKRRAENGPPREVIDTVRAEFGPEASIAMGTYDAKRRLINRVKSTVDPETTAMDRGGPISAKFSKTIDGAPFLVSDKMFGQDRMLIFASETGLELLSMANVVMVDGTFSCVPDNFTQLFSFHVYLNESVVRPVVFCLLANKQLATYEAMLDELKRIPILQNWAPEIVIADYEVNIKTAFENKFPMCQLNGCLFHLIQSWRRQAESLKVYDEFINGPLQDFWQLLKVLPFIDDLNIPHYFGEILTVLPPNVSRELTQFVNYLERNYIIGTPTTLPRFPPSVWSCAFRTVNSIHRTTNTVECWHRLLASVTTKHLGLTSIRLSDLLQKLKVEDSHTCLDAAELKLNPNFQVNKARKISNIRKDRKLLAAIENKAVPPNVPLTDLPLLKSFVYAKKY